MGIFDARSRQQRDVLAKLDRVATVSRGHRAGLHLDDPKLFEQYSRILSEWESQQRLSRDAITPRRAAYSAAPANAVFTAHIERSSAR